MNIIITKFGGTSVSTIDNWLKIKQIIQSHVDKQLKPVIVCSALSQTSNQLESCIQAALLKQHHTLLKTIIHRHEELAEAMGLDCHALLDEDFEHLTQLLTGIALLKEASAKTQAQVLSFGELMMTKLACAFLNQQGLNTTWFDVREGLKSASQGPDEALNYLAARCSYDSDESLAAQIKALPSQAIITQGFIASNPQGDTVLLGRGGSDTTAALLAAKLQASVCEIWTDVPGIYTANPHTLPQARLLKQLNYDEAQEIASMGAKVLHPNCIPPVRAANIPLFIKYTQLPMHTGTQISHQSDELAPPIKSVQLKNNVLLISIDTLNMWQQVGFLADVFASFKQHGFSVDLLSTSEFNVTLSLDSNAKLKSRAALEALLDELNTFSQAKLIEPCAVVSLIGQNIRTILHQLGSSLEVFESEQVHMMSLASNDLNLNFVVNESQAAKLSQKLHALLIDNNPRSFYYSKTWQEEFGKQDSLTPPWWQEQSAALLQHANTHSPCYVYSQTRLTQAARSLLQLSAIDKIFYATKANPFEPILHLFEQQGLNFECVSEGELHHVLTLFPKIDRKRLLFTPNFATKQEYQKAIELGCHLTIDSLYPIEHWPEIFQNQEVFLRIDPGSGAGHHKYVCTGGVESKFGIPQSQLPSIAKLAKQHNIKVTGLHAHFGSGILTPGIWQDTAKLLTHLTELFSEVTVINLGGGLGVVERPGQRPLDLSRLDESLLAIKQQYPKLEFWLEPGRYLVANSGVILAKITQTKQKGDVHFIGIETGMNSLIRPSLYGAYHEIVNLTRLTEDKTHMAHIVGPICESGDTLGYSRMMPDSCEGDVMLIANTGAYGHCMSSHYNLREPAKQTMLSY